MRPCLITLWTLLGASARAACPTDVTAADLDATLGAAETAFASLDAEAFAARMDDAAYAVPCVHEPATPALAARVHRLTGLRWYGTGNEALAAEAFAAARADVPGLTLPPSLVPEGHAARALWGRLPIDAEERLPVPEPVHGELLFDGVPGTTRPSTWPAWVQVVDDGGRVVDSAYVLPGDALPEYEGRPLLTAPRVRQRHPRLRVALGSTALATGVAAGVVYGLAAHSAATFEHDHPDWGPHDLTTQRTRTNRLVLVSASTAGVALAAGITFAVVR